LEIKTGMPVTGIVTDRKCPSCGHHELGFATEDGIFHPLIPGTRIQILEARAVPEPEPIKIDPAIQGYHQTGKPEVLYRPWVPYPVKEDKSLRLKYGVMVRQELHPEQMSGEVFEAAYAEKLRGLIEKEVYTPIAVILDQFFVAPHLASGDPKEIAFKMLQELEEIRGPVELVEAWLDEPNEESLVNLIRPKTKKDLTHEPVNDEGMKEELERLTLEEFLGLL